jgi:hypothetical protein
MHESIDRMNNFENKIFLRYKKKFENNFVCYNSSNPHMTQFGRPTRFEIVHNCMKSATMHELVDETSIFENLRNFDIIKKFLKQNFFHI